MEEERKEEIRRKRRKMWEKGRCKLRRNGKIRKGKRKLKERKE